MLLSVQGPAWQSLIRGGSTRDAGECGNAAGCAWAETQARITVTLKDTAIVPGPVILLGQIASIEGAGAVPSTDLAGVVVGPAPPLGLSRRLARSFVDRAIRGGGVSPESFELVGSAAVGVLTSSRRLSSSEIQSMVESEIRGRWEGDQRELLLEFPSVVPDATIPDRTVSVKVDFSGRAFPRGNALAYVDIREGERILQRIPISVRVRTFGPVVIAARQVAQLQVVGSADLAVDRRETTLISQGTLTSPDSAVGLRARSRLEPGQVLERRMLESIPAVRRGDTVTIIIQQGRVSASVQGKAREDGRAGERIRVRNATSGMDLVARVVDARTVVLDP